jgi:hypothetical protein
MKGGVFLVEIMVRNVVRNVAQFIFLKLGMPIHAKNMRNRNIMMENINIRATNTKQLRWAADIWLRRGRGGGEEEEERNANTNTNTNTLTATKSTRRTEMAELAKQSSKKNKGKHWRRFKRRPIGPIASVLCKDSLGT